MNTLMCLCIKQIVQRSADTAAIRLMRQAVSRHQNSTVPTNFGHGRTMVGSWTGYGKVDLVKTYLAMAQKRCAISLIGTQGGCVGFLSLRGLRAPNGPWRVRCPDMQHFQAALCLHMRDDHAQQLGIRSFSDSRARLTVREIQKITDQLVHLRKRPASSLLTKVVVHARTGMLIKTPWEQSLVHMRAYPFQGLEFHGRNPQTWILYVLNTFPQRVGAFDVLNPVHHRHIGVGLCILFFEVICVCCSHCVTISSQKSQIHHGNRDFITAIAKS